MLIGLLKLVFTIIDWILVVAGWGLVIYFIAKLILPQNKYVLLVGKYVEIVLAPVRKLMYRLFPKLSNSGIDLSPVVLWLLLIVVRWILSILI